MPEEIKATVVKPTPVTQLSVPATETEPTTPKPKKSVSFPIREKKNDIPAQKESYSDMKNELNSLRNEHNDLLGKIHSLLGMKKDKKEDDTNDNVIKLIEKKFKEMDEKKEKEESERDYNEFLQSFSERLGLKNQDQIDYLEYELNKLFHSKGDNATEEDFEKVGDKVKNHYGIKKASTVIPKDAGPSQAVSDGSGITYKQFQEMDIMQRNELFTTNQELFDKYLERENASHLNKGEKLIGE